MFPFFHYTENDLESLNWHLASIRQFQVNLTPLRKNADDLIFDIRYILEVNEAGYTQTPARLTFKGITDLRMSLDTESNRFQNSPGYDIQSITRERIQEQLVWLDRPYYSWKVSLWAPNQSGVITFGAYGFSLKQTGFKRHIKAVDVAALAAMDFSALAKRDRKKLGF